MRKKPIFFIVLTVVAVLTLRFAYEADTVSPVPATSPELTTLVDSETNNQPDDSGQADQDHLNTSGPTSAVEQKQAQRDINAEMATGMSRSEIDKQVAATTEAFFSGDVSLKEHLTQVHTQLAQEFGEEEADFRLALVLNSSDWDSVKKLAANREAILGTTGQYDQFLLNMGIANGQISYEEIRAFSSTGSVLPEDLIYSLASNGRVDLIAQLSENNLLANPNYEQPILGQNAIGALISHASYFPDQYESNEMIGSAIDTLINAGVVPMPVNGGLGPMDHALTNVSNRSFEARYTIVKKLLEHGVPFEQSHRELISSLPNGRNKEKLQQLLREHM